MKLSFLYISFSSFSPSLLAYLQKVAFHPTYFTFTFTYAPCTVFIKLFLPFIFFLLISFFFPSLTVVYLLSLFFFFNSDFFWVGICIDGSSYIG